MIDLRLYMAYYSTVGAMLLLAVLGFGLAVGMPGMDRWNKRFFMCFFAILALVMSTFFVELVIYGDPAMLQVEMAVGFFQSLLPSILMTMLTVYLLHRCGEDWRKSALVRAVLALWAVYFAILVAAQFSTLFYFYTSDGQLSIGPLFPLSMAPLAAVLALNLAGVIRRRDKLTKRLFYAFLIFLIPMTIAVIVHAFVPVYLLINVGIVMTGVSMFIVIVSDQIEQYVRLQQETARQRASIAVLQMRPHFIHNTMTSIYYLCDQDPEVAKQVTMDFNTYLRKNLTAITKDDTIPFAEELEHTRAYLAVEQAQFASKLVVDYDTPHTQFHVPPLTLQPLAENAVKHGMNPNTVPLRVCIRTRKTEAGNEVVVEDNGPGFDPAIANEPHTTLANIRQRLAMMCDGTLDIAPREGGGTVVRVTVT